MSDRTLPRDHRHGRLDPYAVLGVPAEADRATVRAAYIRRMRENHPDRRPGDLGAAQAARDANAAWELLRDPQRRASYDRARIGITPAARQSSPGSPATRHGPPRAAYSAEKDLFRAAFTRATVKIGAAVFALGMVLLALTGLG